MAREKNPNENTKHKNKKTERRFEKRRRNYVDSFRWGFVDGGNQGDVDSDDDLYFDEPLEMIERFDSPDDSDISVAKESPSRRQPKRKHTPKTVKISEPAETLSKKPQAKPNKKSDGRSDGRIVPEKSNEKRTVSRMTVEKRLPPLPLLDDDEDDLNLPSYGRTPVPTDDELPQRLPLRKGNTAPLDSPKVLPKTPSQGPLKPVESKKRAETETSPETMPKVLKKISPKVPAKTSPAVPSVPVRPRKEQMVWDADKREYVPLIIPEKTRNEKQPPSAPPVKDFSAKKNEQKLTRNSVEEPETQNMTQEPLLPRNKQKRLRKNGKLLQKTAELPEVPFDLTPENPQPRYFETKPQKARSQPSPQLQRQSQQETTKDKPLGQQSEVRRPVSVHRGGVQHIIETNIPDPADIEAEVSGFAELGVSETMLESLKMVRYLEPTPIQAGVFKQLKAGVDVMGQAQTGTGKTAAFCIPIIDGIEACPPGNDPVALILVPTRELAVQVRDEALKLAYGRDVRITACYGGKPLAKQITRLRDGVDVVVGTPGRVLDLINRRALSLDSLHWVVLDEADRMLDIGFRPDIEKILKQTPSKRQTLLFSATLPQPVIRLAKKYMKSPEVLDFSDKGIAVETIEQFYVTVDPERKFDALVYLLDEQQPNQAIIFTRTKRGADRLARLLARRVESLAAIHGDLAQGERDRVMGQFRAGKLRYLVATDVVGRGIDVSGISHIINYDIPAFCDDYVHRVGRTGRMGREGVAYTFVTVQEGSELTRIEMRIDKLLKRADLKGFESFTKPSDPNVTLDDEVLSEPKPVYGKPVRKIRRAL
jgi:ATP-dependent RNA helicase DeaD